MKPLPTTPRYRCPSCEIIAPISDLIHDPLDGYLCRHCGETVDWDHEQQGRFMSVAIYAIDRAYGGPEEGGWYYDAGYRRDETLKNFALPEEWPQAQLYYKQMLKRAEEMSDRVERFQASFYVDEMAPEYFPKKRPIYC